MAATLVTRIRMYRLDELGDCFLISFLLSGKPISHMLIDCGSFRNNKDSIARLKLIAEDIRTTLGKAPLNVVVGTHQHNDHLSGFVHCEAVFKRIGIDQVWLSWLDDPSDPTARKIGEKHRKIQKKLVEIGKLRGGGQAVQTIGEMLGFYGAGKRGAVPVLPDRAVKILRKIGKRRPAYLEPGQSLDMPGLAAGMVKIHVLGPPLSNKDLYRKDPRKGESYDHALAAMAVSATRLFNAAIGGPESAREEENYPFGLSYKRQRRADYSKALAGMVGLYRARDDKWRKIDKDWLNQAEALALFMDKFTNNSSLVMAIELVGSGKVLLFPADAQTGNWASWKDVAWKNDKMSTDSLLKRTVFYKVGHHASHNATLVEAFEKMNDPRLTAFIPVHKEDPNIAKKGGWKMPADNLYEEIKKRTANRVLRMDGVDPPECQPQLQPAMASWAEIGVTPKTTKLYIELNIADE